MLNDKPFEVKGENAEKTRKLLIAESTELLKIFASIVEKSKVKIGTNDI